MVLMAEKEHPFSEVKVLVFWNKDKKKIHLFILKATFLDNIMNLLRVNKFPI